MQNELLSLIADLENVISAKGNAHGSRPGIVRIIDDISSAASPSAELRHALGEGGRPLLRLIIVRKQRLGNGQRVVLAIVPCVELAFRNRLDEGSHIGNKSEPLFACKCAGAIGHLLEVYARRMKPEIIGGSSELEGRVAVNRNPPLRAGSTPCVCINGVAGTLQRNKKVKRIAPAA